MIECPKCGCRFCLDEYFCDGECPECGNMFNVHIKWKDNEPYYCGICNNVLSKCDCAKTGRR